jgi:hypothetical protein
VSIKLFESPDGLLSKPRVHCGTCLRHGVPGNGPDCSMIGVRATTAKLAEAKTVDDAARAIKPYWSMLRREGA